MSESVRPDLPASRHTDHIEFDLSDEQGLVIRKAADLLGWTVPQYVMSAVLDRAERDLYEHAAAAGVVRTSPGPGGSDENAAEPLLALVHALG
ncbi:DUF1778 domain-containing protein [Actinomadura barringtoniae]|uniref:DUF1778 domain-containing protein n=1 Tax=Actinomadura barringtoniae TaxID=1427535 RepID=A0A939PSW9_9ACTN|nr:DUF1778 domain-containing protein [Actinomadura barringtoniae]MBO2455654.1 DUF1778 domain-containing protein [Actinomadura barringtoniae]